MQVLYKTININILHSPKDTCQVAFTVLRQAVTFNELCYDMHSLHTSFSVSRGFEKGQMKQSVNYLTDSVVME